MSPRFLFTRAEQAKPLRKHVLRPSKGPVPERSSVPTHEMKRAPYRNTTLGSYFRRETDHGLAKTNGEIRRNQGEADG